MCLLFELADSVTEWNLMYTYVYTHTNDMCWCWIHVRTYVRIPFLLYVIDHLRVILKVPDEIGSDYINTSYINVSIYVCMIGFWHNREFVYTLHHMLKHHIVLLLSSQGYRRESAYIASQGTYTCGWLCRHAHRHATHVNVFICNIYA